MLSAIAPIPSTLQVQAQPQLDSFKHTPRRCVNNAQQKTDRWSGWQCPYAADPVAVEKGRRHTPPSAGRHPQFLSKASRPAPAGTTRLQTASEIMPAPSDRHCSLMRGTNQPRFLQKIPPEFYCFSRVDKKPL